MLLHKIQLIFTNKNFLFIFYLFLSNDYGLNFLRSKDMQTIRHSYQWALWAQFYKIGFFLVIFNVTQQPHESAKIFLVELIFLV